MHATAAAPPPHPTSMVMSATVDDNNMGVGRFPIIQVEVKIRVPDQLVGRLIGKSGICVKKIMEETQSHISISDARNQQEVHQYQTPELLDRIITIRGTAFSTVMTAEKQVQQKLRHIQEQDMNNISSAGGGGAGTQQFCPTPVPAAPPGGGAAAILQSMDAGGAGAPPPIGSYITPSAVTVTGAPMLARGPADNAFHHQHHGPTAATVYSAPCIPMGVAPQSFFVHNHPNAATNFPLTTGQFTTHHNIAVPNLPMSPVQVKSRVYVPNQIVGILIGTKGQTIKSIIADSGAMISIDGGGDHHRSKKESEDKGGKQAMVVKEEEGRGDKGGGAGDGEGTTTEKGVPASAAGVAVDTTATTTTTNGGTTTAATGVINGTTDEQQQHQSNATDVNEGKKLDEEQEGHAVKGGGGGEQTEGTEEKEEVPAAMGDVAAAVVAAPSPVDNNTVEGGDTATAATTTTTTTTSSTSNASTADCGGPGGVAVGPPNTTTTVAAPSPAVVHAYQRPQNPHSPRPVCIQGYDFQVSKAQFWVFQKVAESQNKNVEELELSCEAVVPSRVIGRIIGKGGQNVKKLQQTSGARIKVPDDIRGNNSANNNGGKSNGGDCAAVSIHGNYYAVQAVQQHFGTLISEAEWRDSREYEERRARHWNGGSSR